MINKNYRYFSILILIIIVLTSGCMKKKEAGQGGPGEKQGVQYKGNASHKVSRSFNLVPPETATLMYIKNLDKVKKTLEESDLVTSLKDNYIYQDFKYKYLQDRKLFFVTLNLNIDKILEMVNQDFLYGRNEGTGSFIVAHATLKTRLLNLVFNIITGTSISDKEYEGVSYRAVKKGSGTIYYTMLSDYLTIADSVAIMEAIIDTYIAEGHEAQEDLDAVCGEDDIYFQTAMKENYNTYDIMPDLLSAGFVINSKTGNFAIRGLPSEEIKLGENPVSADILKIIPKDFALFYYKRNYPLGDNISAVINSIVQNATENDTKKSGKKVLKALDVFGKCKEGVCISVNSLGDPKQRSLNPQFALLLEMKEGEKGSEHAEDLMNIFSYVLGGGQWTESKESKYVLYKSGMSDFSLLVTDRYAALCNDKEFTRALVTNVTTPGPSLYDTFAKDAGQVPSDVIGFACVNPEKIVEAAEPLFMQYISKKVSINKHEYNNGFGQVFGYIKEKKPLFITLSYKDEEGRYDGKAAFLK